MLPDGTLTGAPLSLQGNPNIAFSSVITASTIDPVGATAVVVVGIPTVPGTLAGAVVYTDNLDPAFDVTLNLFDTDGNFFEQIVLVAGAAAKNDGTQTASFSLDVTPGQYFTVDNGLLGGTGKRVVAACTFVPAPTRAA